MKEIIKHIQSEWVTLKSAPVAFILLLVCGFGAAFIASNWRYEAIVDNKDERLITLKERLEVKDEQLQEYRERLHLVPTTQTTYSLLSNKELKNNTLDLVTEIRSFLEIRKVKYDSILFPKVTNAEQEKAWQQKTNALMLESTNTSAEYNKKFKVDTILLRDELLSRLPSTLKNEKEHTTYEYPTNPLGMGTVVDDLERLAKNLPIK